MVSNNIVLGLTWFVILQLSVSDDCRLQDSEQYYTVISLRRAIRGAAVTTAVMRTYLSLQMSYDMSGRACIEELCNIRIRKQH